MAAFLQERRTWEGYHWMWEFVPNIHVSFFFIRKLFSPTVYWHLKWLFPVHFFPFSIYFCIFALAFLTFNQQKCFSIKKLFKPKEYTLPSISVHPMDFSSSSHILCTFDLPFCALIVLSLCTGVISPLLQLVISSYPLKFHFPPFPSCQLSISLHMQ